MEADLSYLDPLRVSSPDPAGGGDSARVSVLPDAETKGDKPWGCSSLYEIFLRGIQVYAYAIGMMGVGREQGFLVSREAG